MVLFAEYNRHGDEFVDRRDIETAEKRGSTSLADGVISGGRAHPARTVI
ncbi:hypothetical protein [Curtobacterium sp. MCLR17_045]|nr:hypothetical protein [Curtobacterium sp. MCLR17_045]